uniref:HTH cro/C1-type domain-containing protein n=1 Tax=Macrostomum lignano TaxID=282301 RepID=A0A1I8I0J2_9PLAT
MINEWSTSRPPSSCPRPNARVSRLRLTESLIPALINSTRLTKMLGKLDQETENLHHNRVGMDVGKLIQQGRQAKGLSQKDLATRINEKPQVIAEYENGQAIPNNQVLGKIERQIGIKLRGKEKGQSLSQPTAAPGPAAATGKGKKK